MIPVQHGLPEAGVIPRARLYRARSGAACWIGSGPGDQTWFLTRDRRDDEYEVYTLGLGDSLPGRAYAPMKKYLLQNEGGRELVGLLGHDGLSVLMALPLGQREVILYSGIKMPKRKETCHPFGS